MGKRGQPAKQEVKHARPGRPAKSQEKAAAPAEEDAAEEENNKVTRGQLSALSSAMKQQKKVGGEDPLRTYEALATKEEKHDFCKKWLQDKKFTFITVRSDTSHAATTEKDTKEGWKTKFQIAHIECLAPDNPLLDALLVDLPSREHQNQAWKDQGLKEYYYTERTQVAKKAKSEKKISLTEKGAATEKAAAAIWEGSKDGGPAEQPAMSIEDGKIKVEPGVVSAADWSDIKKDLKKHAVIVASLSSQAFGVLGSLEQVAEAKPYFKPLLVELKKQVDEFTPFAKRLQTEAGKAFPDQEDYKIFKAIEKLLVQAKVHVCAMKEGAFKEAKAIV